LCLVLLLVLADRRFCSCCCFGWNKEHVGGFWIVECADMAEALAWARNGAKACRAAVEVQEIFFRPAPS
jgi:hypothetical protein